MQPSDIFYERLDQVWTHKTNAEKKKSIEQTLKRLHKSYCVIAGDLSLKEQVKRVYLEIEDRKGWKSEIWLKISLGVQEHETDLGMLLTHGNYKDVKMVFAGPEAFDTADRKLFHFEGREEDEQISYISKRDIKVLSFSNYCHWSTKIKSIYRKALGLPEDFDSLITPEEETIVIKVKELEDLRKQTKEIAKLKKALALKERDHQSKHQKILIEEKRKISFEKVICEELDKKVYSNFYEFKDPFLKNYWFLLKPSKKIELAKQARSNAISLESATRLYRDVRNAF